NRSLILVAPPRSVHQPSSKQEPTTVVESSKKRSTDPRRLTSRRTSYDRVHASDSTHPVSRSERNPFCLSPVWQGQRRATRLQPALPGHHGLLGSNGDRRLGSRRESEPCQKTRR